MPTTFQKLAPVLLVPEIAPCLPFWTERLGFQQVAEVPGPDGAAQFSMLIKDGVEVMYQTWASVERESPEAARGARGHSIALYIDVADLDEVDRALAGIPRVADRKRTFYGTEEFTVREPAGNPVTFAMRVED
ncbi:MAG TPA: VOC family protein [Gemmatimonadales bacterium]|nr:VOC family protein [Gemmatimonadales bacterium]